MEKGTSSILSIDNKRKLANLYTSYGMFVIFIVMFGISCLASDAFCTKDNLMNVLRLMSITAISACGMTFVLILGMIDLSVGSVMALAGCCTAIVWAKTGSAVMGIGAGILVGAGCGCISGMIIVRTAIPAFIMTFAMQTIARGTVYLVTSGQPVSGMGDGFKVLGQGSINTLFHLNIPLIGDIPLPIWIMIIVFIFCSTLLNKTRFGRYIYATGGNIQAAKASGIKTKSVIFRSYLMIGVLAAISGVILMSRMNSGQPQGAQNYEFDAISACVVGGTSLMGGSGKLSGTFIGCCIIAILNNILNLKGISTYWQMVIRGLIIVGAVIVDYKTKELIQKS